MKLCWCDSKLFSSDLKLISSELEIIFVCFQVREIIVQVIASYSDVISSNFESFQAHSPLHYCLFYLQPYSLLPPLRPRSTEETSSYLGLMQPYAKRVYTHSIANCWSVHNFGHPDASPSFPSADRFEFLATGLGLEQKQTCRLRSHSNHKGTPQILPQAYMITMWVHYQWHTPV